MNATHLPPSRRALIWVAVLAMALGALLWRSQPDQVPAPSPEPLTLGVAQVIHSLPLIVAEENGFLRDAGLDVVVKPYPSGRAALEAMFQGEVEVADVAQAPVVIESFKRRDFVIFASFLPDYASSKLVVASGSTIQAPTDLRSKRIATLRGTSAQYLLHVLLGDSGIRPNEVVEVFMPPQEMSEALAAGRVDAVAIFEPYASKAIRRAAGRVLPGSRVGETMSYAASRDFPQRRAEAAARLLRATDRACAWIREHPAEAMAIAARRLDLDAKLLPDLWQGYVPALGLDQTYLLSLEQQARWAINNGLVPAGKLPNYLDFLDLSVLAAVKPRSVTVVH